PDATSSRPPTCSPPGIGPSTGGPPDDGAARDARGPVRRRGRAPGRSGRWTGGAVLAAGTPAGRPEGPAGQRRRGAVPVQRHPVGPRAVALSRPWTPAPHETAGPMGRAKAASRGQRRRGPDDGELRLAIFARPAEAGASCPGGKGPGK